MTVLVIDYRGAVIGVESGALAIRLPDGSIQRAPLTQVERVLIQSDATLHVSVLRQLSAARIGLHVLRGRSRADCAVMWPQSGDALRRLAQRRAFDDEARSLRLARLVVRHRLLSQMRLMDVVRNALPRIRYPLSRARRLIAAQLPKLSETATIDSVRGLEGGATSLYFAGYKRVFHSRWAFNSRRRRPPTDPVNACLSLGFSLLHSAVLDEIHVTGLDAALGVLHRPLHNRASLACDLVELERHVIEMLVWQLFRDGRLSAGDFDRSGAGVVLGKSARGLFFGNVMPVVATAAKRTSRRLRALVAWLQRTYIRPTDRAGEDE